MKNFVLYTSILFSLGILQLSGDNSSSLRSSNFQHADFLMMDEEEHLSAPSSDEKIFKKKRTRIRHADEWGRIEPEQSFKKAFTIEIGSNSVSEVHFTTPELFVHGQRGPPVI